MNPFEIYKALESAKKASLSFYNEGYCEGKDYVGEDFTITDNKHRAWVVAVRQTGRRGRYIKIKSKSSDTGIRASADGYKPEKYHRITPQEWDLCAEHALKNKNNCSQIKTIISRLIT